MKFDIQKNVALHGNRHASFTEVLLEVPTLVKAAIFQHWHRYLLSYAIKSERRTLATLNDRELEDMGINRIEAIAESKRRFNDLPGNRKN